MFLENDRENIINIMKLEQLVFLISVLLLLVKIVMEI